MGGGPSAEEGRVLSNRFDHDQFVAAISRTYNTGEYESLDELVKTLVASYGRGRSADVIDTARNDSMLAIALKMQTSTPAVRIAPQVPMIIRNKLIDAYKAEQRDCKGREAGADESVLTGLPARDDVQEIVELRGQLREAFASLVRLKAMNERYYDAVLADFNGATFDELVAVMTSKHGPMTRDTVSAILSRGHKKLRAMCNEANSERA